MNLPPSLVQRSITALLQEPLRVGGGSRQSQARRSCQRHKGLQIVGMQLCLARPQLIGNPLAELLDALVARGVEWVQTDEPILGTELDADWQHAFNTAYHHLKSCGIKLLLATYFGQLAENRYLAASLPVAGLHIDAVNG